MGEIGSSLFGIGSSLVAVVPSCCWPEKGYKIEVERKCRLFPLLFTLWNTKSGGDCLFKIESSLVDERKRKSIKNIDHFCCWNTKCGGDCFFKIRSSLVAR